MGASFFPVSPIHSWLSITFSFFPSFLFTITAAPSLLTLNHTVQKQKPSLQRTFYMFTLHKCSMSGLLNRRINALCAPRVSELIVFSLEQLELPYLCQQPHSWLHVQAIFQHVKVPVPHLLLSVWLTGRRFISSFSPWEGQSHHVTLLMGNWVCCIQHSDLEWVTGKIIYILFGKF